MIGCLAFSEKVMVFFCAPLTHQLDRHNITPQMYYSNLTDPFMTYLKIAMITACALAGPWMIYQLWLFVAAGLYPNERKTITRYIPLSITLFLLGLVFVYVIVLPLSIGFFIDFAGVMQPPLLENGPSPVVEAAKPFHVPIIAGDPKDPQPGDFWYDDIKHRMKIIIPARDGNPAHNSVRSISFVPESLMAPIITIGTYIDLVLTFEVTFGVAFQLPLVILAVVSIGIVDVPWLRKQRKIVFFGMTVASAFLAPGDIITSMLALLIPLIFLYEFGLWLVGFTQRRKAKEDAVAPPAA